MEKTLDKGLEGLNPHHFNIYPMTKKIAVAIKKAFFFPYLFDKKVTIGMTKRAVNMALTVENHAGQLPAAL